MEGALRQALLAVGACSPNPPVGAVIVKGGVVIAGGFTQPPGKAHAEVEALQAVRGDASGAHLFVTLEPCCHFGRTPPCTDAIIAAGIAEVHIGALDPNPLVNGRGKETLEAAGIRVHLESERPEIAEFYEAHAKYIRTGIPFVIAKYAMSLDGKIATKTGDSRWITGVGARRIAHEVRGRVDAVMVGVNTVLRDDPHLTARDERDHPRQWQPLRVLVDSTARTPLTARVAQAGSRTLIAVAGDIEPERERQLRRAGVEVAVISGCRGKVDLPALLRHLGKSGVTSVLVEGGGTLLGSFFDQGLVDKVMAFIAPVIVGGRTAPTPVAGAGVEAIAQALRLARVRIKTLDDEVLVIGYAR